MMALRLSLALKRGIMTLLMTKTAWRSALISLTSYFGSRVG